MAFLFHPSSTDAIGMCWWELAVCMYRVPEKTIDVFVCNRSHSLDATPRTAEGGRKCKRRSLTGAAEGYKSFDEFLRETDRAGSDYNI